MSVELVKPLRYSGEIKVGRWTSQTVFGGYDDPINFMDFSIAPEGDLIVQTDNGITNFGMARSFAYQPKPSKLTIEMDELNTALLADVVRGIPSVYSQSNDSSVDATVTLVLDKWVDLGIMNVSDVVLAASGSPPAAPVKGTDYEVDAILGQVRALTSKAVGSQDITFKQGAIAGNKIISGNASPIMLGFKGRVMDHNSGETGVIEVPKAAMDPKTVLQLIGAKGNQQIKFEGFIVIPPSGSPFTFYPELAMTAPI
jgi:hypothetical protein